MDDKKKKNDRTHEHDEQVANQVGQQLFSLLVRFLVLVQFLLLLGAF